MADQQAPASSKRTELHMARSMCWHCQSEVQGEYFCQQCVKVQPVAKDLDYFTCLGFPRKLVIDLHALEAKFYQMSRVFHPDFYHGKDDSEQSISLGNSALVNVAYRTLKDPIQRAEYLLRLESGSAKDIRNSPPADLFEEILALQDDLDAYREATETQASNLQELRARLQLGRESLEQRQREIEGELVTLFAQWDALPEQEASDTVLPQKEAVLRGIREVLSNRTYIHNIVDDLVTTLG